MKRECLLKYISMQSIIDVLSVVHGFLKTWTAYTNWSGLFYHLLTFFSSTVEEKFAAKSNVLNSVKYFCAFLASPHQLYFSCLMLRVLDGLDKFKHGLLVCE